MSISSKRLRHQQKLMNPTNGKLDPKAQAALDLKMEEDVTMTFKFKELLVIFNVLISEKFQYGNLMAIHPIINKLHPIVDPRAAVDSNILPKQEVKEEPIIGAVANAKKVVN